MKRIPRANMSARRGSQWLMYASKSGSGVVISIAGRNFSYPSLGLSQGGSESPGLQITPCDSLGVFGRLCRPERKVDGSGPLGGKTLIELHDGCRIGVGVRPPVRFGEGLFFQRFGCACRSRSEEILSVDHPGIGRGVGPQVHQIVAVPKSVIVAVVHVVGKRVKQDAGQRRIELRVLTEPGQLSDGKIAEDGEGACLGAAIFDSDRPEFHGIVHGDQHADFATNGVHLHRPRDLRLARRKHKSVWRSSD